MTMYRIDMDLESNDCKCGACDLLRGVLVPVEPTTDEVWVSNVNGADTVVDVDGRCIDTVMSVPKMDVYLVPKGGPA